MVMVEGLEPIQTQGSGGALLPPVQTLVATIIFAQKANMQIESRSLHHKKVTTHSGGDFFMVMAEGLEPIQMQGSGGALLPPVQTLVATIFFAQRAKMQIESRSLHHKKSPPIRVVIFLWSWRRDSNPSKCKAPVEPCCHQCKHWWLQQFLPKGQKCRSSPVVSIKKDTSPGNVIQILLSLRGPQARGNP